MQGVPFELVSPRIPFVVMQGRLDGRAVPVLLDTGTAAPFTILVSPEFSSGNDGEEIPSSGAVGDKSVSYRAVRIRDFTIGDLHLTNVNAGASEAVDRVATQLQRPIKVIAGQNFVKGKIVAIDYVTRRVDFAASPGPIGRSIKFTTAPKRPLTLVQASINKAGPFTMVLDSGASSTLLSPQTATAAKVATTGSAQLAGGGGSAASGANPGVAHFAIGSHEFTRLVAVADVLGPIEAATGAHIDGILGADLFLSAKITIDYRAHRIWIDVPK